MIFILIIVFFKGELKNKIGDIYYGDFFQNKKHGKGIFHAT